eukprot:scaffold82785_cov30-Tisochrysis_lutea.AAC.4
MSSTVVRPNDQGRGGSQVSTWTLAGRASRKRSSLVERARGASAADHTQSIRSATGWSMG